MHTRYLLALTLLLLIVLQSCCREPDAYYRIADADFDYVAYDSTATFRMQDSLGNVNTFIVEDHSLGFERIEDCAECCDNNFGQTYTLRFRGDNPALSITINLRQDGYGGNPRNPLLEFWLYPSTQFQFVLNRPDCPSSGALSCGDSLQIAGQQYFDVIQLYPSYDNYNDSTAVERLWYNTSHGILKYRTLDGQVWEAMP